MFRCLGSRRSLWWKRKKRRLSRDNDGRGHSYSSCSPFDLRERSFSLKKISKDLFEFYDHSRFVAGLGELKVIRPSHGSRSVVVRSTKCLSTSAYNFSRSTSSLLQKHPLLKHRSPQLPRCALHCSTFPWFKGIAVLMRRCCQLKSLEARQLIERCATSSTIVLSYGIVCRIDVIELDPTTRKRSIRKRLVAVATTW
ncbi:pectin lyase-like superfamily protein [Striga asiatica]|uniref:Pectin lyase-like superfamily protein n=1 Tax=Striga asiatica TaxID=4170 RepID=A0A5A7RBH0_STRAF|nr:pectin lyase-like superfamily protein [Striga asiatica]